MEAWKEIEEAGFYVRLMRSRRKSLAIEVKENGSVIARAPMRMSEARIRAFIQEKSGWIQMQQQKLAERVKERREGGCVLSKEERDRLVEQAARVFPERAAIFAQKIGVTYGNITIRDQKTRWGSCSRAGNLNFNFRLVMAPPKILDYVVVHELCHRKQMNHSPQFWAEVAQILPDYEQSRRWLRENGWRLMG